MKTYTLEAIMYPPEEHESTTAHLVGVLEDIADQQRSLSDRHAEDSKYPEIRRYQELAVSVECLIDCAGYPFPDYRDRLIKIAALALDAALAWDRTNAPGESGEVVEGGAS